MSENALMSIAAQQIVRAGNLLPPVDRQSASHAIDLLTDDGGSVRITFRARIFFDDNGAASGYWGAERAELSCPTADPPA